MNIPIIGTYITSFGELWNMSLRDLLYEAIAGAVQNAHDQTGIQPEEIEAIFVSNKAGGSFSNQRHLNALASQFFPHFPPAVRVEAACASGGLAIATATQAILSGKYQTALVIGVEKMTDVSVQETTSILSSAADSEREYGSTFPGLYGLLASINVQEFGTTREQLSAVAVKNHLHALTNPHAQFRKKISLKQVNESALVADPLRVLDCSPISDGAAAVVLSVKDFPLLKSNSVSPAILASGHGQDTLDLASRKSLTQISATVRASQVAYREAGISPQDIQVAEVHDCFTIAEILAIEDLGFFEKGQGGFATLAGDTTYGGKVVINPSGGLKACGHPVGATGVKQLAYIAQLIQKGEYSMGLTHNVGGSGATAVVHIVGSSNFEKPSISPKKNQKKHFQKTYQKNNHKL